MAQGKPHAGIILMRQQYYSVGEQMRRILKLMASRSAGEMRDRVEFLSVVASQGFPQGWDLLHVSLDRGAGQGGAGREVNGK